MTATPWFLVLLGLLLRAHADAVHRGLELDSEIGVVLLQLDAKPTRSTSAEEEDIYSNASSEGDDVEMLEADADGSIDAGADAEDETLSDIQTDMLGFFFAESTTRGSAPSSDSEARARDPPHIVHFMADDLGFNDLGFMNGGKTYTPSIDKLIRRGMLLSNFHTYPVCAPSRASTMTGRYPFNVGFYVNEDNQCTSNFTSLPALLKDAGYSTHAVGKWDIGFVSKECTPTYSGFDTFLGYYTVAQLDYFYHNVSWAGCSSSVYARDCTRAAGTHIEGKAGLDGTYSSRIFTAEATRIIHKHAGNSRPLYLYVAPMNVHLAIGADKACRGVQAPCSTVDLYPNATSDTWKVQSAMTTELDFMVGNVTTALQESGLWDRTLVIFASDNGGPLDHTTNYPLRGGKDTLWDGGVKVVSFLSGPHLPLHRQGTTYHGMMHSADWYRTIVQGIVGAKLPAVTGPVADDSFNLWRVFTINNSQASPRHEVVHEVENEWSTRSGAIRVGHMKLLTGVAGDHRIKAWASLGDRTNFGESGGSKEADTNQCRAPTFNCLACSKNGVCQHWHRPKRSKLCKHGCLFNVTADPTEENNLIEDPSYKTIVKQLRARLANHSANAQPKSEYFTGHFHMDAMQEICKAMKQSNFLEPLNADDRLESTSASVPRASMARRSDGNGSRPASSRSPPRSSPSSSPHSTAGQAVGHGPRPVRSQSPPRSSPSSSPASMAG